MKKSLLLTFCAVAAFTSNAQTALFNNRGADMYVNPGAFMIVKTDSLHNHQGLIQNAGGIVIEGNIYNDDRLTGSPTTATGLYKIQGNWINNGTVISYQDSVELFGDAQFITGSQPTAFHHLILSGVPGSVKTQTLNASVSGILNLNDHELATQDFEMLVTNPSVAAITKASGSNGYVSSTTVGKLSRSTNTTNPYFFPTGTPSAVVGLPFYYRPIELKPTSSAFNTFGVRTAHDPAGETYDTSALDNLLCRVNPLFYHRLYHSAGSSNADVKMFFDAANDGAWSEMAHWETTNVWHYMPTAVAGNQQGFSTVTVRNWNDFNPHPFVLASKKFTVDAGPDQEIYEGQTANLQPTISLASPSSLLWTPALYLNDATLANATSTPKEDIEYTITVTNAVGCRASDSMKIKIQPELLLIPTAFSPNGDGIHEIYRPLNNNLDQLRFQIFNRWGEKVFETDRTDEGWDGVWRGVKQDIGVYVWKAEYRLIGSATTRFASGNVTLVK